MKLPALRPRHPFIGLAFAAILGIFIADHWAVPPLWACGAAILSLLAVLLRPARFTCWLFCLASFLELHAMRQGISDARWLAEIFTPGPRVVQATGIVWGEPEKPVSWVSRDVTFHFPLKLESLKIGNETVRVHALINVDWAGSSPAYGDRVVLTGSASNLEPARNPGQFDSTAYQQRLGIYSAIRARFATDCRIESHRHGNPLQAVAFTARHWVQKRLEFDIAEYSQITAVIDGVVLGLRGESPEDLKMLLQRTGTIHLFVVSGLNVAMLTTIAFYVLKPFGLPRALRFVLIVLLLFAYTFITGLHTSTVRATIMATFLLAASLFDRRAISLNSLAAAALAVLAWDTEELFAPGFQFSFTIVFVIIAFTSRIQRRIEPLAAPDPFLPRILWSWPLKCHAWCWHHLCAGVAIIIASWVGSLLFTMGYFHLFSPGSLVANFFAVPVAFLVLSLGLASLVAGIASSFAAVLLNNANWFAARLMLGILHFSASLPCSYLYVAAPRLSHPPLCQLTVFDLADGGAIHLRADRCDWLLDCGDEAHYGRIILPYLRSRGVNRLDGLLLTHGDVKHIGAALTAITDFRPRLLADSTLRDRSRTRKNIHTALEELRIGKGLYGRDDWIHLGHGASLRVLYPPLGLKRSVAADMALVLQLQAGHTRALLMSNSGFNTEQWLLENEPDLHSDIVIKGQHPSDLSGTINFLARVAPRAVICGPLRYGQPVETLDDWESDINAQGITVFRQDKTGAVTIDIENDDFEIRSYANGQTFRSRAR